MEKLSGIKPPKKLKKKIQNVAHLESAAMTLNVRSKGRQEEERVQGSGLEQVSEYKLSIFTFLCLYLSSYLKVSHHVIHSPPGLDEGGNSP